jgi:hypothetical protein
MGFHLQVYFRISRWKVDMAVLGGGFVIESAEDHLNSDLT